MYDIHLSHIIPQNIPSKIFHYIRKQDIVPILLLLNKQH
jgi:hypothetical protein